MLWRSGRTGSSQSGLQLRPEATGSEQDLGTQSIRLARAGHLVLVVEPDPDMRTAFSAALDAANWPRFSTSKSAWAPPTRTGS